MKKTLIVVTNHAYLGDSDEPNGTFSPELTHFIHELDGAGKEYDIASIHGGVAPLYGTDIDDAINAKQILCPILQQKINKTLVYKDIDFTLYDSLFFPGGFGLLSDLATDIDAGLITAALYEQGLILSAVCHGPAALLQAKLSTGEHLIGDHEVTAFTYDEEREYGTLDSVPLLLESELSTKAKKFSKLPPWKPYCVVSEGLITGQNPASTTLVAKALLAQLN